MSTSPFLDAVLPLPAPPEARYIWAVVTQASPLRIKIDGDRVPLGIAPDTLVGGLAVDQRVYCQIISRRLVVLGVSGGPLNTTPAGAVLTFAGSSAPAGYLLCDGAAVSRTAYAALYAALGGTASPYGQGNGSTTFNLPNLKGRVPVGRDAAQTEFDTLGGTGGAKTHTLTVDEMPSHTHVQNAHSHSSGASGVTMQSASVTTGSTSGFYRNGGSNMPGTTSDTATNQNTGGGAAHNNLPPYIAMNYIIKY